MGYASPHQEVKEEIADVVDAALDRLAALTEQPRAEVQVQEEEQVQQDPGAEPYMSDGPTETEPDDETKGNDVSSSADQLQESEPDVFGPIPPDEKKEESSGV